MARLRQAVLSAFLLALPGGALAQFRTTPMVLRLPYPEMDALADGFSAAGGASLLVLHQTAPFSAELRPWRDLLQRIPSSFPLSGASGQRYRSGHLPQNGGDALADVARPVAGFGVRVVFGNAPASEVPYATVPPAGSDSVASFLRLLPRSTDVLVVPENLSDIPRVVAIDVDGSAAPPQRVWSVPSSIVPTSVGWHEAFPARISAAARSAGIDDVAIGVFGGVLLLTHDSVPGTSALSALSLSAVLVGGSAAGLRPSWLPASAGDLADALGVAALDVDLDGNVDLVITNATAFGISPPHGSLLWIQGTGLPADFGNPALTPWRDLGIDPALGLVDPLIVRGLTIEGAPSFAVWDRALQEVIVATPDASAGLRVWRAPAPGERAVNIQLADVVGSPAPDLVVAMSNPSSRDAVLVYADLGDPAPDLAWAPGSPGAPARGLDLAMAVIASDDAGEPRVDWTIGDPAGAPVARGTTTYTYPGASLCTLPPPDLAVTVRATDALGVFTELQATLPVSLASPGISVAAPGGRLVLPPGGASAVLEGTAALVCGATATWGGNWPAGATFVDEVPQGSTLRRTVTLPEATYPELLAGPVVVSLTTSDPVPNPTSTVALDLDASGLVEVLQGVDRPILEAGDLAVLKLDIRSRIGVPIPLARVVDVLSGLAPAGAPRVSGAAIVEVRRDGAEVVLDRLPASSSKVEIELPVSSLGGRGASAVEVRSSGDYLLTPGASATAPEAARSGCSCGVSPGGALALVALLALARPRSRPRAAARRLT